MEQHHPDAVGVLADGPLARAEAEDETQRLRRRAERALQVLHAGRESSFDRIAELARTVFEVPISTINLLDQDVAWFKSCVGIDLGVDHLPRSAAFCDHAVSTGQVTIVTDATLDPRFRDLPSVTGEPHLRFYAGFPIRDTLGTTIGTLCLYDVVPRTLDEHQQAVAVELAGWVETELRSSREIRQARAVQRALLPADVPTIPGYDAAALCAPATTVAGDFYDHLAFDDRHAFVVADVMGKGMGAAIVMSTVRAVLRSELRALAAGRFDTVERRGDLRDVLDVVNATVLDDLGSTQVFVTGLVAVAEPATGRIDYVDAGHGLTVVLRADGRVERLASHDLPLGVDGGSGWTPQHVVLEPGDHLVCFSDGLLDLLGITTPGAEELSEMRRLAAEGVTPAQLVQRIAELVGAGPLVDDVTVLAIRRDPAGVAPLAATVAATGVIGEVR